VDDDRFDRFARALATRRGVLRGSGLGLLSAVVAHPVAEAKQGNHRRKQRHKNKQTSRKRRNRQRVLPVFSTCHTATEELGSIPGGPYPTCQSPYDPEEFAPCDTRLTMRDLQEKCEAAFPACAGDCRVLSEPVVGLGDCPDLYWCNWLEDSCVPHTAGPIPGGPYGSCWSWTNPFMRCWSCPGHTPDHDGMVATCNQAYPGACSRDPSGCYPSSDQYSGAKPAAALPGCVENPRKRPVVARS
jgi:hypothetical protein